MPAWFSSITVRNQPKNMNAISAAPGRNTMPGPQSFR